MAIDKAKLLKSAEKFIASGKIAQAIEEYLKILKENPKDWNLMIQVGDLYLKINKTSDAIQYFQKVADHYYHDGFFLKAIAIYKRINKLDPSLTDICIKLADLYLKQGLTMDAKSQLQVVAQHYISKNQTKEAIQTFKKLIEIEPDNLRTRNELAGAYKNEGMIAEAVHEYLEISDELTRKNLLKESLAVLETAYKLDPRNSSILRKILTVYSHQGETDKATHLLEETLKVDPTNVDVLSLLAETYAAKQDYGKAHDAVDKAIAGASNKEPFLSLKGDIYLRQGDLDRAFQQYSQVVDRMVQRKAAAKGVALLQKVTRIDSSYAPALQKLIDLYSILKQETNVLSTYSSLVDAYISRAQYAQAAQYLEKLISMEPDNAQHQEKLEFVKSFLEKPAVPEVSSPVPAPAISEIPSPVIPEEVSSEDFEIGLEMDLGAPAPAKETKPEPIPSAAPARVVTTPRPVASPLPVAASVETPEEEKEFVSEHMIEAEVFTKYGLIDKAIEQLQMIVARYPNSVMVHQKLKEIYLEKGERDRAVEECVIMSRIMRKQGDLDQAEDLLSEARQINPNHPALDKAYKEIPAATVPADVMGEIEKLAQSIKRPAAHKAPAPPKPVIAPSPPPPPPPVMEEEIEIEMEEAPTEESKLAGLSRDAFEEIDFYADQGLLSEARRLLYKLREQYPEDPGVQERLARLGEPSTTPEPVSEIQPAEEIVELELEIPAEEPQPIHLEEAQEISIPEEEMLETEGKAEPPADMSLSLGEIPEQEEPVPLEKAPEEEFSLSVELPVEEPQEEAIEVAERSISVAETMDLSDLSQVEAQLEPLQGEPEATGKPEEESVLELAPEPLEEELSTPVEEPATVQEFGKFGELEDSSVTPAESPVGSLEEDLGSAIDRAFQGQTEETREPAETQTVHASEELFQEEEDFFDLAAELEDTFLNVQSAVEDERPADGQNYSLEEILSDFKKGVEKQLGAEDYDTRYNLGIAYKEMGLIDEAIAEFQIASKDPKRFLECCSMLGLCFLEKGMPKLAVKWYERGLETSGYSDEEYIGLRFDLANAYEVMGEEEKALEAYQEVYGLNANYRNVAKKIKDLQDQVKKK